MTKDNSEFLPRQYLVNIQPLGYLLERIGKRIFHRRLLFDTTDSSLLNLVQASRWIAILVDNWMLPEIASKKLASLEILVGASRHKTTGKDLVKLRPTTSQQAFVNF